MEVGNYVMLARLDENGAMVEVCDAIVSSYEFNSAFLIPIAVYDDSFCSLGIALTHPVKIKDFMNITAKEMDNMLKGTNFFIYTGEY